MDRARSRGLERAGSEMLAVVLLVVVLLALAGCAGDSAEVVEPDYWPTASWRSSTPEEQGMSSSQLAALLAHVQERGIGLRSLLVIRNGYLVTEAYFDPYGPEQPHQSASVTKSVVGALTGIAIKQGDLEGVDQAILPFFDQEKIANVTDSKRALTLEHLLTMTSGLDYDDLTGFRSEWMEQSPDWVDFVLDLPVSGKPGARFAYSSASPHLVSAVLQQAVGRSALDYANQHLFAPMGIAALDEERWGSDPQGVSMGGYGLYLTPREMAKLGYLYLRDGRWEDEQLLPGGWVTASTRRQTTKDDGYGYGFFWTVDDAQGSYAALGRGGQEVHVLPEEDLVVVFTAGLPAGRNQDFEILKRLLDDHIVPAVKSDEPLAADPAGLRELQEQVARVARPSQAVPPLPPLAAQLSQKTFALDRNAYGWGTIAFTFAEGAPEAGVIVDGAALEPIGMDNVYRVGRAAADGPSSAMKGSWTAPDTFLVHQVLVGELNEYEFIVSFQGDSLLIEALDEATGARQSVRGRMVNPG